ncbi:PSD1 and planctomycete cytochrome C domain-containing protein [Rubripirellula reticaptiva]|uniref:Planctomycete cytochrome C n=1 Tax=Rubripirellula reticaptiva TaxID=2528013 RepID=A0A5C6F519_9BACT|nr:PSD1 and planctomycete cytochrome C domain-containing protein [Rubripirellula reticaptiva]TWU56142.1 Planctomycete cytochrome C [Rubripirellula reticaptiva]
MRTEYPRPFLGIIIAAVFSLLVSAEAMGVEPIDFNRDVRPILIQHCTSCHGGVKQAGDVSFVYADLVLPPDGWIVEPGDPDASVLIERITTDDPDARMPPPDEHPEPLSAEKVATLTRWIAEGAKWGDLWSMAPLETDFKLPVHDSNWARKSLDEFVLAGVVANELTHAPEAPPAQWLRRASFDLNGLPPTIDQIDSFLKKCVDANSGLEVDQVYAAEVDRMLASPNYGQRWASLWMDLARYADSRGFEKDPHRDMWPYRDWLIDAFNRDMPYDEFTIKQLAGDQLPDPTADELIATAFHRNTQTNTEGGTDDEEFRVAAIIDRVNTTWTVWQATTFGCVQCHSHPYDPIEHDEYYRCMALFDNSSDADLDDDYPTIKVPMDRSQIEDAVAIQRQHEIIRNERNEFGRSFATSVPWNLITPANVSSTGGQLEIVGDHVQTKSGTFPVGVEYTVDFAAESMTETESPMTALRIEIARLSDDPTTGPEKGSVLSKLIASLIAADGTKSPVQFTDVFVDSVTGPADPRDALKDNDRGVGEFPKLNATRWAVFVLAEPLQIPDAASLELVMRQKASTSGNNATPIRRFAWSTSDDIRWIQRSTSDELRRLDETLSQSKSRVDKIQGGSLPVMASRPVSARRETRTFTRGNWMDRGEEVEPGIPSVFANADGFPVVNNRLQFAKWLVSTENPLAARVWANRVWAQLFGRGLVETQEDFGSSGLPPSDPLLLDHIANRLQSSHQWHLKPFLRELVLSSTYRQDNEVTAEQHAKDAANRYYARGPRTGLSAEMVRDQAIEASGLINNQVGGPSVMPPQPDGVWQTIYSGASWENAKDSQRYRQALYTYWRRTSPYPSFLTFDSPTRDLCSARRIDTNTPLQALVTLNDPVYQECSHALADRSLALCDGSIEHTIQRMYRSVTGKFPTDLESTELLSLYRDLCDPSAEDQFADQTVDRAAMAIVANTILNLDKALTK